MELFRIDTLGGEFVFASVPFCERVEPKEIKALAGGTMPYIVSPALKCDYELSSADGGEVPPEAILAFSDYLVFARGLPDMEIELAVGKRKITLPISSRGEPVAAHGIKSAVRAQDMLDLCGVQYPYFEVDSGSFVSAVLLSKSIDAFDAERFFALLSKKSPGEYRFCLGLSATPSDFKIKLMRKGRESACYAAALSAAAELIFFLFGKENCRIGIWGSDITANTRALADGSISVAAPPLGVYKLLKRS